VGQDSEEPAAGISVKQLYLNRFLPVGILSMLSIGELYETASARHGF